jgi:WD40 repeat protein
VWKKGSNCIVVIVAVKFWDFASGRCLATGIGHTDAINSIAYNPSGALLVSCSVDNSMRIWEADGYCRRTIVLGSPVFSVAFNPAKPFMVVGSKDSLVRVYDTDSFQCVQTLSGHTDRVNSIAYDRDGIRLVSVSADCRIVIWELFSVSKTRVCSSFMVPPLKVVYGGLMRLCCVRVCND